MPAYTGDLKFMNAKVEYAKRCKKLSAYKKQLNYTHSKTYRLFLEKKISKIKKQFYV